MNDWRGRIAVHVADPWPDYALLDTGGGRKLERYGPVRVIRPEAQAMWAPASSSWEADAEFIGGSDEEGGGRWVWSRAGPEAWPLEWRGVRFLASCTPFRHLAFFPDMAVQWDWMRTRIGTGELLNLFGYTGLASLIAAERGAKVTHVDASKKAVTAARRNQEIAGLEDQPIRWIVDDAMKFTAREVRRGRHYAGQMLDPPKYGRGPEGEVWHLEEHLPQLLRNAAALTPPEGPAFVILTVYAVRLSALALGEAVADAFQACGGHMDVGEMALREEARGRLLPTALSVRWWRD